MKMIFVTGALALGLGACTTAAKADDIYACTVFLCTQPGVDWPSIAACVGPVTNALYDASWGIPFPPCPGAVASATSNAVNSSNGSSP